MQEHRVKKVRKTNYNFFLIFVTYIFFVKETIKIVYHRDQLNENNREQFEIFVEQLNLQFDDLNLQFEKFDLAEHSHDDLKAYIDEVRMN